MILTPIERFRTVTPVWIHRQLQNDAQSLKGHRRGALLFFELICQILRSQGQKNADLAPIWAFLDDNSNLNSKMAIKWHIAFRNMEEILLFFYGFGRVHLCMTSPWGGTGWVMGVNKCLMGAFISAHFGWKGLSEYDCSKGSSFCLGVEDHQCMIVVLQGTHTGSGRPPVYDWCSWGAHVLWGGHQCMNVVLG